MEFKFDTAADAVQPLYAAVPGVAFSLGNTEVAFHVHADGAVHVMSAEVERALSQCRSFRSLDEHVATIVQRNPALADKQPAVRGVLEHLTRIGVLVPARDVINRLGRDDAREPAPLRAVVVRAGSDAGALAATLDSAAAFERATGTRRRWAVLADAGEAAAAVDSARAQGLSIHAVEPARVRELLDAGGGATLGAANLAILLGAGARIAQVDAGTRFDFRRARTARDRLALPRPGGLPLEVSESPGRAAEYGEPVDGDAIAGAEAWCGRTLGAVIARGVALDPAGVAGHAFGRPELEPGMRIAGVDFAIRGVPRGEDAAFPWNLRGEARAALWRSREAYDAQRARPCVATAPVDAQALVGVSTVPFMLDGARLLPPTIGDDAASQRLFGTMLRYLHPDALVLRGTATLARDVPVERGGSQPFAPALADLVGEIAIGAQPLIKSDDAATRLARFAMLVRDLGEAPARRRLEVLAGFVAHRRAAHLTQLQNDLEASSGAPGWWTDDLREAILATGRPLTAHTTARLAGWPETLDEAACTARLGAELLEFAELCERWPALWTRAAGAADGLVSAA